MPHGTVAGEALAVVLGANQARYEIVGRGVAALIDQVPDIVE